jgi:hypothetical protein
VGTLKGDKAAAVEVCIRDIGVKSVLQVGCDKVMDSCGQGWEPLTARSHASISKTRQEVAHRERESSNRRDKPRVERGEIRSLREVPKERKKCR